MSADWGTTCAVALGSAVVLYIGQRALWHRTSYPLPPGPPGLPWVGNVTGVNTDAPWITYAEWGRKYGNLVYSRLLGKDIIIINSEKIAKELLENRSGNYSDRPYFITSELCGLEHNSPLLPYGDRWRLHRRFFHQTFRLAAAPRFVPHQDRKACNLVRRLFDAPDQLHEHVFEYTAGIIMNSVYGYDPVSRKDELVDIVANMVEIMTPALRPDVSIMLGAFPWLHHLPSWFPGMSFKRDLAKALEYSKQYLEQPFGYALQKASSSDAPFMVHDALREMKEKGISPDPSWMYDLKLASGSVVLAASDTSNAVLMTFFFMMMVNPGAQEKAHAQIDALLGNTRLPTSEDRPHLPFVDAIYLETLRYNPVAPLSVPHSTVQDDVYDGFHIPKGAFLVANLWGMTHDETKYPNPHHFSPERYLNDDGSLKHNDTEHVAFGFGRRICVGRHIANNTAWLAMAKVLAAFKILKPLDEHGVEISVEPKFSSGLVIQPLPFKYRIIPRFLSMDSEKLEELIAASVA